MISTRQLIQDPWPSSTSSAFLSLPGDDVLSSRHPQPYRASTQPQGMRPPNPAHCPGMMQWLPGPRRPRRKTAGLRDRGQVWPPALQVVSPRTAPSSQPGSTSFTSTTQHQPNRQTLALQRKHTTAWQQPASFPRHIRADSIAFPKNCGKSRFLVRLSAITFRQP